MAHLGWQHASQQYKSYVLSLFVSVFLTSLPYLTHPHTRLSPLHSSLFALIILPSLTDELIGLGRLPLWDQQRSLTQGGQQTFDAPRLCCPPWRDHLFGLGLNNGPHPKGSSIQHLRNLRLCCSPWDDHHFQLGLNNGPSSQGEQHPTPTQSQALLLPLG